MEFCRPFFLVLLIFLSGCGSPVDTPVRDAISGSLDSTHDGFEQIKAGQGALLLTRFHSFEDFKKLVKIEYLNQNGYHTLFRRPTVRLTHWSEGRKVTSTLTTGINEWDFLNAAMGGFYLKLGLLICSPYAVLHRKDLNALFLLSRRREAVFGEGDIAFYDLAARMMYNIDAEDKANHPEDVTDEGYLNTFLHMNTQAFISSIFSEKLGDFIGDAHERHYIPELITGAFSEKQILDIYNGATDNYLDIINNEWGQELGKELKAKYKIGKRTFWTAELLANYLNDIQSYYCWAFQIGMKPFRATDDLVIRFANKINFLMQNPQVK